MLNFFTRNIIIFALLTLIYRVGGFEYAVILALTGILTTLTFGISITAKSESKRDHLQEILKSATDTMSRAEAKKLSDIEREIDEKINRKV